MTFNFSHYRLAFRALDTFRLPDYAGSRLRGMFGYALRQLSCVTKLPDCATCPMKNHCPYTQVFEPKHLDKTEQSTSIGLITPYLIHPPVGKSRYHEGDILYIELGLLHDALKHLPLIILALRRAFLRGLYPDQGKADLILIDQVFPEQKTIYTEENPILDNHETQCPWPEFNQAKNKHVCLLTPLRIEQKHKVIGPKEITASVFFRHLIRRVSLIVQKSDIKTITLDQIRQANHLADLVEFEKRVFWKEIERYSFRQQQSIPLGGVLGRLYFKSVPVELLPFLELGQWLNLGKETTFGLGRYRIEATPWQEKLGLEHV
jgi:hypothetical protein